MALIIGVTGSIAAGKSHLCRTLIARHGAVHADADEIVHGMYVAGTPAFTRIIEEFGEEVVGADGEIDRRVLGERVFGRPERMRALTAAIGDIDSVVRRVVEEWRAALPADGLAVLEAVHLIEAGYAGWCDATWLVGIEDAIALLRLIARNELTEAEALQRLASARAWEDRLPAADRLFLNNGTVEEFEAEIDAAIEETLSLRRARNLPAPAWHRWWEETREERERLSGTEGGS